MSNNDTNQKTAKELSAYCKYYGAGNRSGDFVCIEEWSPSYSQRLDVMTLDLKTWIIRGFEIKVSRADFLADKKWEAYLPYVNYFWFVIPNEEIIKPSELDSDIGLLVYSEDKKCLRTIKKGKQLQPKLVRMTFGELRMTRILSNLLRSFQWRDYSEKHSFKISFANQINNETYGIKSPGLDLIVGRIINIIMNKE